MEQKTTLNKLNDNQKITDGKFKIKLRKIMHPFLIKMAHTKIRYKLERQNKYSYEKNKPIIFAVNHSSSQDTPIICNAVKKHCYILAGVQPFEKVDELFFSLNGTIFVDRKNKEDMALSKKTMIEYLNKGQNIIMFPEGTWNLDDAKLMLDMKWGIIDVARDAKAQIIPVALDYDNDKKICRIKFGDAFCVSDNNQVEINKLRDTIASLRFELYEKKEPLIRSEIDVEKLREQQRDTKSDYPKLDSEYEKSVIFKPYLDADEVFAPIKKLSYKKTKTK